MRDWSLSLCSAHRPCELDQCQVNQMWIQQNLCVSERVCRRVEECTLCGQRERITCKRILHVCTTECGVTSCTLSKDLLINTNSWRAKAKKWRISVGNRQPISMKHVVWRSYLYIAVACVNNGVARQRQRQSKANKSTTPVFFQSPGWDSSKCSTN